jgi:hypothetical protein
VRASPFFSRRGALALALVCAVSLPLAAQSVQADPQRYLHDVQVLAAPNMQGRGAGTRGLERAGDYLAAQYKKLGLEPAGDGGTYFQSFTVTTGARLRKGNRLCLEGAKGACAPAKVFDDYLPFSFSSSGEIAGPVVFAGYGITAPEFGYDDYAHLEVNDKVVLVLRYEPEFFAAKSDGHGPTPHAAIVAKAINARNHGARAVILINGIRPGEEDLLPKFGAVAGPEDAGILVVQAKNRVAETWFFAPAGKTLAAVQAEINQTSKPQSFAFAVGNVRLAVQLERTRATVRNVAAYLPGASGEYIVIGGHYDHLGRGDVNSLAPSQIGKVHPGADDNASGASGVVELARMFSAGRAKLPRGVLFLNFAGEEIGILGSSWWVNHPTRPLKDAVAMINMDMIGRIRDDKVYVGGVGTGTTFKPLLDPLAAQNGLKLAVSSGGYAASDHTSFVAKQVPSLFFFSGLHADYHKPSDTADKIQPLPATRLLDLIAALTVELAGAKDRPQFVKVEEPRPAGGGGGGGYGAYFGSIPDFGGEEGKGVKFADVSPGSPAAKAGLKAGDVLVRFGDKPITNLYDFTYALRAHKPGDVVVVKVLRDSQPVTASVTLGQRK